MVRPGPILRTFHLNEQTWKGSERRHLCKAGLSCVPHGVLIGSFTDFKVLFLLRAVTQLQCTPLEHTLSNGIPLADLQGQLCENDLLQMMKTQSKPSTKLDVSSILSRTEIARVKMDIVQTAVNLTCCKSMLNLIMPVFWKPDWVSVMQLSELSASYITSTMRTLLETIRVAASYQRGLWLAEPMKKRASEHAITPMV